MPEIVKNNNEITVCPCGHRQFELLNNDFNEPVAFCLSCQRGKSVELWQQDLKVGYVLKTDFLQKYPVMSQRSN